MRNNELRIEFLGGREEPAHILAPFHACEWCHLYSHWDEATAYQEIHGSRTDGQIPCALGAFDADGHVMGSASVIFDDLPGFEHLNPWIASVFVLKEYRNRGIAAALIDAAEKIVAEGGYRRAWLFTEHASGYFKRLGWHVSAEAAANGVPVIIMTKEIPSVPAEAQGTVAENGQSSA